MLAQEIEQLPGLDTEQLVQTLRVRVLDGELQGEEIILTDDF